MKKYYVPRETFSTHLGGDFYAVLNPYVQNPVAVITGSALRILKFFRGGKTLEELRGRFPDAAPEELRSLVRGLTSVRLLFTASKPRRLDRASKSLGVRFHITNRCNLACRYCYVDRTAEDMTVKTARKIADAVFRSVERHGIEQLEVKFSGGEASLNPAAVFAAVRAIEKKARDIRRSARRPIEVRYDITTNGIDLPAEFLARIKRRRIHLILSLDGPEAFNDAQRIFPDGSGTFRRIMRSLEKIRQSGIAFNFSTVVSGLNIAGLPDLMEFFLQNDHPFVIDFYRENPCSEADLPLAIDEERFLRHFRKALAVAERILSQRFLAGSILGRTSLDWPHSRACGVGQNYLVFDQKGNVAKCQMAIGEIVSSADRPDPLGDVRRDRKGLQNPAVDSKHHCRTCLWRYYCAGDCAFLVARFGETAGGKSPFCRIFKALIPDIVRLEGLRLLKWGA